MTIKIATIAFVLLAGIANAQAQNPVPPDWQQIEPDSAQTKAMFPEAEGLDYQSLPVAPRVILADVAYPDGPITFAMWIGPDMCSADNTCTLKIFAANGDHIGGEQACDRPEAITVDDSHQQVHLCSDIARPIADLIWKKPTAVATAEPVPAPPPAQSAPNAPTAPDAAPVSSTRSTAPSPDVEEVIYMNHNGSVMAVAPAQGTISYAQVREGLRGTIADGAVLFRGAPWRMGEVFSGQAHTFRKGCAPAPYDVVASYEGPLQVLTLRGAAPVRLRQGCTVTGYSADSGNAMLEFHTSFD